MNGLCVRVNIKSILEDSIVNDKFYYYDLIVRYLAIENCYGLNDCGWEIYKRYAKSLRGGGKRADVFRDLIKEAQRNRFDDLRHPILISNLNGEICVRNGFHRLALAIYWNFVDINCVIKNFSSYGKQNKRLTKYSINKLRKIIINEDEKCIILMQRNKTFSQYGINEKNIL